MVTFKRKDVRTSSGKSSEKIVSLMESNPDITIKELSQAIKLSTRAIEKNIEKLKKDGKIIRVGSDKGGYWRVNN